VVEDSAFEDRVKSTIVNRQFVSAALELQSFRNPLDSAFSIIAATGLMSRTPFHDPQERIPRPVLAPTSRKVRDPNASRIISMSVQG
jgi:hypothetical protein